MAKTFEESWEHSIYAGTALSNIRKPIFKDGWHARDAEIEAKDKQIAELTKSKQGIAWQQGHASRDAEVAALKAQIERVRRRLNQIIEVRGERGKVLVAAEMALAALEGK